MITTGQARFFYSNPARHTTRSEFSVEGVSAKELPRVEIVSSHANAGREVIDFLVGRGVKGLVLAGVGDGNATDEVIAALRDAAKKGVAVVRATRTGSGIVARNVEVKDDDLGFIASQELSPQKARVLLMLGLMKTSDPRKLQEYFDSERGRAYIRSTLGRSRVVEGLIDEWLAGHPEHAPLPHLEDGPESAVEGGQAAANASIDATDPGAILEDVPAVAG